MTTPPLPHNPERLRGRLPLPRVRRMSDARTVTFYLHDALRRRAEAGEHNFIARVVEVLQDAGLKIAFDADDDAAELRSLARPGYGIFHMRPPIGPRQLVMRLTYLFPFWRIEKSAERWEWPVARERFDPASVDAGEAAEFAARWGRRLFEHGPERAKRNGFIYVPLQGRLREQRSFQTMAPLEMLRLTCERAEGREVVATLHPKEHYSTETLADLDALRATFPHLDVRRGEMERHLRTCDFVVTQNSSAGFMGYFFGKPLVLFGKADFHHIALKVEDLGAEAALARAPLHRPDYAAYLYWFLQLRAINAGRPEASERIRLTLRGHGWPV